MLKEGHKHLSGLEEAVLKNIEACKQLAQITRTSMGPNGGISNAASDCVDVAAAGPPPPDGSVHNCFTLPALPCRHEQDGDQPPREAVCDQ